MKKLVFTLLLLFSTNVLAENFIYSTISNGKPVVVTITEKDCTDPKVLSELQTGLAPQAKQVLTSWASGSVLWEDGKTYQLCWSYSGGYIYMMDETGSPFNPLPVYAFQKANGI